MKMEVERRVVGAERLLFALMLAVSMLLAVRPMPQLVEYPFEEDGYLALTVARQIGTGGGVTVDGVSQTNGFQPLWVFACAPLFAATGGERVLALRLVILLQVIFYGTAGLLMVRFVRCLVPDSDFIAWTAGVMFLGSYEVWKTSFSGMETGLLLMLYLLVLRALTGLDLARMTSVLVIGFLLGVLVLARIDAGFFAASVCIGLALHEAWPGRLMQGLRRAVVAGAIVAAVNAPWWWYNFKLTGSFFPQSGQSTFNNSLSAASLSALVNAIARDFVPFVALLRVNVHASTAIHVALGGLLVWYAWPRMVKIIRRPGVVIALCAAGAAAVVLSFAYLHSIATWFYPRYFVWLAIPGCIVTSLALERFAADRLARLVAVAVVGCILWGRMNAYAFVGAPSIQPAAVTHTHPCLSLASEHLQRGELLAAGQSGVLGFFRDGVVNLDGKVNLEALMYRGQLSEFLNRKEVRWICDDQNYLASIGFNPAVGGFRQVAERGNVQLFEREQVDSLEIVKDAI